MHGLFHQLHYRVAARTKNLKTLKEIFANWKAIDELTVRVLAMMKSQPWRIIQNNCCFPYPHPTWSSSLFLVLLFSPPTGFDDVFFPFNII